jgi:S-adenosylmethionine:tRNA ribosyltransferase-isomerase
MVFNDTKVVPARLHFQRESGAHIEIFCLEPVLPEEYVSMFAVTDKCRWKCIVGNVKRWKNDTLKLYNPSDDADIHNMNLKADLVERCGETSIVEFSWSDGAPFSKVLEVCGSIPIPPYLNRETEDIDLERYQTLYAKYRGSVAAPTAGLHFTPELLEQIKAMGVGIGYVTLHVGLGTFRPVKADNILEHHMHAELCMMRAETAAILNETRAEGGRIICVGTTSCRTLESLVNEDGSFEAKSKWTEIFIYPGYTFKAMQGLITNFHLPESTLVMLVSAFAGRENVLVAYEEAVREKYRFFSFGDAMCIL